MLSFQREFLLKTTAQFFLKNNTNCADVYHVFGELLSNN